MPRAADAPLAIQLEAIRLIDRRIDGLRLELFRRGARGLVSADDWQRAWDRNPDLATRNDALFRQRGLAQAARDALIERAYRAGRRAARRAIAA